MDQNLRMFAVVPRVVRIFCGMVVLGLLLASCANAGEAREERVTFEGVVFRVVKQEPEKVRLELTGGGKAPMRTFGGVQAKLAKTGRKAIFLMNGGIFEPGGIPTGMHIEDGKVLCPLNLRDGEGNFYMKPNGLVVWGAPLAKPQVVESVAFSRRSALPAFGVQSGPLLVLGGKLHPAFRRHSVNFKHRNGVGVNAEGQLVFAMTDENEETNFHKFARLFRDKLGCPDALFLDGDISQMVLNPDGPVESNRFGAIFVGVENAGE